MATSSRVKDMPLRRESVRNVIRINATSIDLTGSDNIAFGYVNEIARVGRIIAGRHRLMSPLRDAARQPHASSRTDAFSRAASNRSANRTGAPSCTGFNPGASGESRRGARAPSTAARSTTASSAGGSSIWRAESLWFGSPVMVELLDPAIAEDPGLAQLFVSEARSASAVSSPFVNRVLDFGIEHGTPYLVTELPEAALDGAEHGVAETLAQRIASRRRLDTRELLVIFRELALAVDALHALGLLHRDLRSQHVTLCRTDANRFPEQPVAKLSFAISKLMNDTLELVRTMARRAVAPAATPLYASPEQVLGTAPVGPQSDLWSLAVIAFECATGELPFAGATIGERLVQICAGSASVPSEVCNGVPPGFDAWFARGVEKVPAKRWSSAREMADALAPILSS
jgi:serine/threonine protein kinase